MKKLFLLFALLVSAVQLSFADSALTSTEFYKAYLDVPIVKAAAERPTTSPKRPRPTSSMRRIPSMSSSP